MGETVITRAYTGSVISAVLKTQKMMKDFYKVYKVLTFSSSDKFKLKYLGLNSDTCLCTKFCLVICSYDLFCKFDDLVKCV